MALIVIQDSPNSAAFAEVFGNAAANQTGFLAQKARVRKDTVSMVSLSGNGDYVDVEYGVGNSMTLNPNYIDSVGGIENTGYSWTGEQLFQIICNYMNI